MILSNILKKILIFLIKKYRYISPFFYRNACRFNPTCSFYAIQAIEEYGPIIGIYKSFLRICRCHPFGKFGDDPLKKKGIKIK